jgi:hypothetical protein
MLVLGTLNWAVEWWHPGRGSVEAVVANAQTHIRHGLAVKPLTVRETTAEVDAH